MFDSYSADPVYAYKGDSKSSWTARPSFDLATGSAGVHLYLPEGHLYNKTIDVTSPTSFSTFRKFKVYLPLSFLSDDHSIFLGERVDRHSLPHATAKLYDEFFSDE